jgi:hypothetical protein
MKSNIVTNKDFFIEDTVIGLIWLLPVLLHIFNFNTNSVNTIIILVSLVSFIIIFLNPFYAMISLPFFTLLSPLVGFFNIYGIQILLSDILFIILSIKYFSFFIASSSKNLTFKKNLLFLILAFLFFIGILFAIFTNKLSSTKPILYLFQFIIIYFFTRRYIRDGASVKRILNAWIFSILIASLILQHAFINGINLSLILSDTKMDIAEKDGISNLFQATYYYTGFHFLLGIAIIYFLIKFIYSTKMSFIIFNLFFFIFLFVSLLLMFNKTALMSDFITVLILLILLKNRNQILFKKLIYFIVFLIFLISLFIYYSQTYIDTSQLLFYSDRVSSDSSLIVRIGVYLTAFSSWIEYPINIIVGLGPSFLDGSGNQSIVEKFTKSKFTGMSENTVDSGWISYLLELGVFSFLILSFIFFQSIKRTIIIYFKNCSDLNNWHLIFIPLSLFFLVIALFTQMLGYTKTSWFPFQLLLIGFTFKQKKDYCVKNTETT